MLGALRTLVEVETPTGHLAGLTEGFEALASLTYEFTGRRAEIRFADGVPYLYLSATKEPSVLVIGHLDTVWPVGTLAEIPFSVEGDRARGPGVFDMKAGLVIALGAIAGSSVADHIGILVTGDEEIGSPTGRALVEQYSPRAAAVFVPEPAAPGGSIKMARKGVGIYQFTIRGRGAHSGLEPERGLNATIEMGALIADLVGMQDLANGTTVTPTTARSGVTINTVPADATLNADVRAWTTQELQRIDIAVRARKPHVSGVEVTVTGGINRPPLEASTSSRLVDLAKQAALDVGLGAIGAACVGGGSDGNFCAALGIATLDGVGAAGGGAHASDEWADVSSLTLRSAWLAMVAERVVGGDLAGASR
jgi:glutamate carboxypeptidase